MSLRGFAAISLALAALRCSSSSTVENTKTPAPAPPRAVPQAAAKSADQLLVGTWRLTAEEAADGQGAFFEQKRRIFVFADANTYEVENFVGKTSGSFLLQGTRLTLQANTRPELVELVSVTMTELVLIEDLPEIYLRNGPARRVRNTYRRVTESEFGPMLGSTIEISEASPGEYSASYEFSMSKLPTMEITSDRQVSGRARLRLSAGGAAESCIGVHAIRRKSESKYSSPDGQHHSSEDHSYWLAGRRGRWQSKDGKLLVTMERTWPGGCDTSVGPGDVSGPLDLECVSIAANNKLPVPLLACRIVNGHSLLNEISINPADTERAGPYTMQEVPLGHVSTDAGRPWLFLAAQGLAVRSEDGRRSESPLVDFSTPALPFAENQFIERK